jgi:predicted RNA-binding protein with PIN domain
VILFVDGYNLYFSGLRPGSKERSMEKARGVVLDALAVYRVVRSVPVIVFFDGGPAGKALPRVTQERGIEVHFSDPGLDADRDIMRAVAHWHQPSEIRVVTSDQEIRRHVTRIGAKVVSSQAFTKELPRLAKPEDGIPRDEPLEKYTAPANSEVEYWMRVFSKKREQS